MRLNELRPASGSRSAAKRVGRGIGSGLGKTSGSGHKGQKARAGGTVKPGFEGGQMPLQRRLPKYGFKSRVSLETAEVRLAELARVEGDEVDVASLKRAGVIRRDINRVKIVLSGNVDRALNVRGCGVTRGAREAIEKAGGKIEE